MNEKLGVARSRVELSVYDPSWTEKFEYERERLSVQFPLDHVAIHHVGSTSVPGLVAKPIIDILVVLPTFPALRELRLNHMDKLADLGYVFRDNGSNIYRMFFTRGQPDSRSHYLHVGIHRSREVENMLVFRDFLRVHPTYAQEYADLKLYLMEEFDGEQPPYMREKNKFVNKIIQLAKK